MQTRVRRSECVCVCVCVCLLVLDSVCVYITASVFFPLPFALGRVKWKHCCQADSLDAPEETPLLDSLDAIKVQYEKERGRHVRRAQYNQAAATVARCDPAQPAPGLAQTTWLLMGRMPQLQGVPGGKWVLIEITETTSLSRQRLTCLVLHA